MTLTHLFNPKSVAVIGASNDKSKVGYALMANLLAGAKREIYPVSLSEQEILGQKAYASITDIPGKVDLAVIAVRSDIVPSIIEECGAKKVGSVIIISAGFKEIGPTGIALEKNVVEIAKRHGMTILGPNCLGAIDAHSDLNASFAAVKPKKGGIAFISQSGALGTAMLDKALAEGVGFSKFVSLGNEAMLSELDFLEFLKGDKDTRAILMYVEQLASGPQFMQLAAEITKKKPIVLIKAGRGACGQQAVMSHTGSLAPEDSVFTAACRQSGIIVVDSIREFFNMAKLFELGIVKPIANLLILTNAGGPAVVAADEVDLSRSLSLIELPQDVKDELRKVLPPMAAVNNPVDIIGDALSARYDAALKILSGIKSADAILVILTPQMMTEAEATAEILCRYKDKKTIIPAFMGGSSIDKSLIALMSHGLVNFSFPKDAIETLDALANGTKKERVCPPLPAGSVKASLVMMRYENMHTLFNAFDLHLPGFFIREKHELSNVVLKAGPAPYVVKVISPDVIHKTDMGAIKLNIRNIHEADEAWEETRANVFHKKSDAVIEGMLVQAMLTGKEVIVGMKRDPIFGPVILVGLGGIFTEALKDTSMRIAPVTKEMALAMIHEIKGIGILTGLRGEQATDIDKLADIVVKVSLLAVAHPEVREIDLNPVMMRPGRADIADSRVMIEAARSWEVK